MRFRYRLVLLNLVDGFLLNLAVLAALALRFDGELPARYLEAYGITALPYTAAMLLLVNLSGINRSLWRYAGVPTLVLVVRTLTLGFAVLFIVNLIPSGRLFPASVVILAWILATGFVLASRLLWKMVRSPAVRGTRRTGHRILIVGAGDVGAILARELQRSDRSGGIPVGFVDDDPQKRGRRVETLPVLGTSFDIPQVIDEHKIREVLIAAPSAPARLVRSVVQTCQDAGVDCRTVPALSDYIGGKGALGQVREVQIEDLLGREPVSIDLEGISDRVGGRTILVTGAGGSIGSELCRQLARFSPGHLIALDHCENRLCYLGLDLAESHPDLHLVQVVGDIRDEQGIRELFETHRPEIVFHAAAHKHVHFLERTPREAILNNILGTRNLARAAEASGVDTFVFISTDKAVNPSNVMGASKRGCEILLQAFSRTSKTTFAAVRFGNVLGSDGSVLPIFKRQLAKGGPLTVTHPDVRRYFMTIPEASQLVIQAALFGTGGEVFVLDMGEQVRILDVAEQLIRLSGLRPGIDVPIRFVGLRPGEKLEEELLTDTERTRVTEHHKIFRLELDPVDPKAVEAQVERLEAIARCATDPEAIRRELSRLVPEYAVRDVVPLPSPAAAAAAAAAAAGASVPRARVVPRRDPPGKRALDASVSALLLAALTPVAVPVLLAYRISGRGSVRFVREERIGRNRRRTDRRRVGGQVPIDRRYDDRRQRPLPGRPFIAYRLEFIAVRQTPVQRALAGFLQRRRFDRVLWLWSVLRGDMSLVGPAARLVSEAGYREEWARTWVFARRPGLAGVGSFFEGPGGVEGRRRAERYESFYARHGGLRLDVETLTRSVVRLLRGEEPFEEPTETWSEPAGVLAASGQEGRS